MPREMRRKKIGKVKVGISDQKVQNFEKNRFSAVFDGFRPEMGFRTWRIRFSDPFYMQIALRTPLIEAEIPKIRKITIFMVCGT